jgi:hypothetical protein
VWQGLLVWKVGRFGRSLIDGLLTIERVRRAGGNFFSSETVSTLRPTAAG